MEYLVTFIAVILGLLILDQFGLWLEKIGWIKYRYKKSSENNLGSSLHELKSFLNPPARYVVELQQQTSKSRDDQGNDINSKRQCPQQFKHL